MRNNTVFQTYFLGECLDECDHEAAVLQIHAASHGFVLSYTTITNPDTAKNADDSIDVVILNIGIDNENKWIDALKSIKENHRDVTICIISERLQCDTLGYGIGAFRYLDKPYTEGELGSLMDDIIERLSRPDISTTVETVSGSKVVRLNDLKYIQTVRGMCQLIMVTGVVYSVSSLEDIIGILPEDMFGVPRKGYIVNFRFVSRVQKKKVIMTDGLAIPLCPWHTNKFMLDYNRSLKWC